MCGFFDFLMCGFVDVKIPKLVGDRQGKKLQELPLGSG